MFFVKEGSIIPTYSEKYKNMDERPNKVLHKIYGENAKSTYYYDDGKTMEYKNNKFNLYNIIVQDGEISVDTVEKNIEEENFSFILI